MSEQLNIFIITRAHELSKFSNQLVLIYDFLGLMSVLVKFSDDARLKEPFHSFTAGFMPQTLFFLA